MNPYESEQEQIEQIKRWWSNYGRAVTITLIVTASALLGWRYWQSQRESAREQASMAFSELLDKAAKGNVKEVRHDSEALVTQFPKTPYADWAGLIIARQLVMEKQYDEAKKQLQKISQISSHPEIRVIARARLARLLIELKQAKQALAELNAISVEGYTALIEQVKGDAFVALKQTDKARDAYDKALTALPKDAQARELLEIKRDDV